MYDVWPLAPIWPGENRTILHIFGSLSTRKFELLRNQNKRQEPPYECQAMTAAGESALTFEANLRYFLPIQNSPNHATTTVRNRCR
jgi:hypothetical protein